MSLQKQPRRKQLPHPLGNHVAQGGVSRPATRLVGQQIPLPKVFGLNDNVRAHGPQMKGVRQVMQCSAGQPQITSANALSVLRKYQTPVTASRTTIIVEILTPGMKISAAGPRIAKRNPSITPAIGFR